MSKLRKTSARSGGRSVKGGAIFAALALALSASAYFSTSVASGIVPRPDPPPLTEITVTTEVSPSTEVALGTPVHDVATVTSDLCADVCPSESPTVTFELFQGSGCEGELIDSETVSVDVPDPTSTASSSSHVLPAGDYSYLATYENSEVVHGTCEPFTVDPGTPSVSTTIIPSSVVNNNTVVRDTVQVTGVGGFTPTGTVSFSFYNGWNCDSFRNSAGSVVLNSNGFGDGSDSQGPLAAGEYSFLAHYQGDDNFVSRDGVCENLTVNGTTPVVPPQIVLRPVIIVQQAPPPVEVSPAAAVRATGTFTG